MTHVAMLSLHTSPLARLGVGDGGGMNVYVRELAERMQPAGVRVDVYTPGSPSQPDVVDLRSGLRVHHVDVSAFDGLSFAERTDHIADEVERAMARNGGADVLHAHYWTSGAVGHVLKHRLDLPLVTTFHTLAKVKAEAGDVDVHDQRAASEEAVVACSDAVIANGKAEAADLTRLYGVQPDRLHVIPPGVDHQRFGPRGRAMARRMLNLPADRPIVLFAGRIQPIKGADIAVEMMVDVRTKYPDALLIVLGGPSGLQGATTMRQLREFVNGAGLQHNVRFVGPQPQSAMAQWYSAADVCVMPSRSESFGLVALEASACGTPVVVSAVGGLPNVVTDEHSGYVVPPEDPQATASAVCRIFGDVETADSFGRAGAERARSFDWDATVSRTYSLYGKAMDARLLSGRLVCNAG